MQNQSSLNPDYSWISNLPKTLQENQLRTQQIDQNRNVLETQKIESNISAANEERKAKARMIVSELIKNNGTIKAGEYSEILKKTGNIDEGIKLENELIESGVKFTDALSKIGGDKKSIASSINSFLEKRGLEYNIVAKEAPKDKKLEKTTIMGGDGKLYMASFNPETGETVSTGKLSADQSDYKIKQEKNRIDSAKLSIDQFNADTNRMKALISGTKSGNTGKSSAQKQQVTTLLANGLDSINKLDEMLAKDPGIYNHPIQRTLGWGPGGKFETNLISAYSNIIYLTTGKTMTKMEQEGFKKAFSPGFLMPLDDVKYKLKTLKDLYSIGSKIQGDSNLTAEEIVNERKKARLIIESAINNKSNDNISINQNKNNTPITKNKKIGINQSISHTLSSGVPIKATRID